MIEIVQNSIQLLVTGICTINAAISFSRHRERTWILLGLFSGSYFLGDLYWMLVLLFYQRVPEFSYIADLNWYVSSYVFLLLLLSYVRDEDTGGEFMPWQMLRRHKILWLVPVFTGCMCIFFMQWGHYFVNIMSAAFMTLIIMLTLDDFLTLRAQRLDNPRRNLDLVALLFCLAEYGLWTSACLQTQEDYAGADFWISCMLSFTFILFPLALGKVVRE